MADEMEGLWIGPMPVADFLQEFLPPCVHPLPHHKKNLFASLNQKKNEKAMYAPFVSSFTQLAAQSLKDNARSNS